MAYCLFSLLTSITIRESLKKNTKKIKRENKKQKNT